MELQRCVCVRRVPGRGFCFLQHEVLESGTVFLHVRDVSGGLPAVGDYVDCTVWSGDRGLYATQATIAERVDVTENTSDDDDDNLLEDPFDAFLSLQRHLDAAQSAVFRTQARAAVAVKEQSGFPVDNFVKSLADPSTPHAVDDDFVCSVCLDVQREAMLLVACGHSFCRRCVDKVIATSLRAVFPCPKCRALNSKERDCVPDQRNRRKIGEMITFCHRASCSFLGRCDALEGHACPLLQGHGAGSDALAEDVVPAGAVRQLLSFGVRRPGGGGGNLRRY